MASGINDQFRKALYDDKMLADWVGFYIALLPFAIKGSHAFRCFRVQDCRNSFRLNDDAARLISGFGRVVADHCYFRTTDRLKIRVDAFHEQF